MPRRRLLLSPSLLSADFGRLAEEIAVAEEAGADWIHVDVMDGVFVPNLTIGLPVVEAVRRITRLPVDVHLMIVEPERWVQAYAEAGADIVTFHVEAAKHVQRTLDVVRKSGKKAGLALNPHTSEACLEYVLGDCDLVLPMTVNPGFSGQRFLPSVLPKIRALRSLIDERGASCLLEVDGGASSSTIGQMVSAGADAVVAGAAFFGQRDRVEAARLLRTAAEECC